MMEVVGWLVTTSCAATTSIALEGADVMPPALAMRVKGSPV